MTSPGAPGRHDVVVLSDLHIGRGRNPETGRYHPLETFFHDLDLRRFLAWCAADAGLRGVRLKVVFNGDTFDLLRTEIHGDAQHRSRREARFGLDPTPEVVQAQMELIVAGHPGVVDALADLCAGGHEIAILPGNHDLEIQWSAAQAPLRAALREALARRPIDDLEAAAARLTFPPWFVYEPGRLWIEHGCQYDAESAFHFPLRQRLEAELASAGGPPDKALLEEDLPLGSFFQRYLYNAFGAVTFLVPSTRANARYARWLLLNQPRLLAGVALSHLPFIWEFMRRLAGRSDAARLRLQAAHQAALAELAETSGLGERLHELDARKVVLDDLARTLEEYGRRALRGALKGFSFFLAGALFWSTGLLAIGAMASGFGVKTLLFLLLNLGMTVALGAVGTWLLLRSEPPPSPATLRIAARGIARLVDVPIVSFGHTHEEVFWRFERAPGARSTYINTGTWVAVFAPHEAIPRERVQRTFLRIVGDEPELLHWSPGRGEPLPVILFDDERAEEPAPEPAAL